MVAAEKAKALLAVHGKVRPQLPADWSGTFPLPTALAQYYQAVGPANITITAPGNPYLLPSLAALWKLQKGYRYGPRGKAIEDWNPAWIVVADSGGDPLVFDSSSEQILHAYPGEEQWDAVPVFPDLNSMAACLAQLGTLVSETEGLTPRAFRQHAEESLRDLLGPTSNLKTLLDELGYEL